MALDICGVGGYSTPRVFINGIEIEAVKDVVISQHQPQIEVTMYGDSASQYVGGVMLTEIRIDTEGLAGPFFGSFDGIMQGAPLTAGHSPAKEKAMAPPKASTVPAVKTFAEFRPAVVRPHGLPNMMVLHGPEGVGKTSFAAQAPSPYFVLAPGETGLLKLMDNGRVPETPYSEATTWDEAVSTLEGLLKLEHAYRTVVLDAIGGFEKLLHEKVCAEQFGGDWGEKGFFAYGRGPKVAGPKFRELLMLLDRLKRERRMGVIVLAHTAIKTFNNPTGDNYDRYAVDLGIESWSQLHKAADLVLFANHVTVVKEKKGGVQGVGDANQRVLYTERAAAHDAKNRHGLPPMISMGTTAAKGWAELVKQLKAARVTAAGSPPTEAAKPATEEDENTPPAGVSVSKLANIDVPGGLSTGDGALTLDEAEALPDEEALTV